MKFEEIIEDMHVMYKAFKTSKNRRSYTISSINFEEDVFTNLMDLQKELKDKTYQVSGYTEFEVTKPKRRKIQACKFRDKVVQHVLCDNVIKPIMPGICIKDNYSGQEGKGTGMARKRIIKNMKEFHSVYGNDGYVYRGDIHKYYYNIDHEMAKDIMKYYMPQSTHWLIDRFIDSTEGTVGLALGNQINTFVSNLYLDGLDKFITGELGIEYYGRYADDFYLIHMNKAYIKYCEQAIREYLGTLHLELNPKSQIIPLKNGIKFTGFHYWTTDRGMKIHLINEKKREHRRKFNRLYKKVLKGELTLDALERSQRSWEQHASHATDKSSLNYYHKNMQILRKNNERKKRK